jgi:hypothetical protein
MKKFILLLLLLSSSVYSQDAIIDIVAKETCECMSAKKTDLTNSNLEELQMSLGLCMLNSYSEHSKEFDDSNKIDISDEEQMSVFGEKIAMKMINYCPDFIIGLGKIALAEEEASASTNNQTESLEGIVTEIKTEQFVTISVKDKNNRIHKFLLLDYFDTASLFMDGEVKKGTQLLIYYSEIELYDPILKDFRFNKVISGLEKK